MINLIRDNGLLLVLLVLPLSIIAHNLFGAALAGIDYKDNFDKDLLKKGIIKGGLVYLGILIYAGISFLMEDLQVQLNGNMYSLVDAMYVIVLATVTRYAKQGIENLIEIMKYKVDSNKEED